MERPPTGREIERLNEFERQQLHISPVPLGTVRELFFAYQMGAAYICLGAFGSNQLAWPEECKKAPRESTYLPNASLGSKITAALTGKNRQSMAKFEKGKSGNPRGRPKASASQRKLREAIHEEAPEIIKAMVAQAKGGDVTAARVLLDRVLPVIKPSDMAVALPLNGSLGGDGRAVMTAIGKAELTPEQGAKLLAGIGSLARIVEIDEVVSRLEALEETVGEKH